MNFQKPQQPDNCEVIMNVSYSSSSIVGHKDSYRNYRVKLPLTYPSKTTTNSSSSSLSPNDEFHKQTAAISNIIKFPSHSLVNAASVSVLNDLKTIVLTPLEFETNKLGFNLKNIIFDLPHPIISTNCFTVQYHENDNIIIDFIDESYLCITLKISVDNFVRNQRLPLDKFETWGQISVPYSFELRSSPFYLTHLDDLNLIVSLKDGGLLHFKRQEVLGEFTVNNFQEQTQTLSFFGLFGKSGNNKNKEIVLEGISSNSIVDALRINDLVITLSANKVLKIWQLETHQNLDMISLTDDETNSWLTAIPSKYFKHIHNDDKHYITFFITTESGDSSKSMFAFKMFELEEESSSLKELTDFLFQPEVPNSLLSSSDIFFHESTFQNTIWFIQDYDVNIADNSLEYHLLWKSNTSSILVKYSISLATGSITSINISHPGTLETGEEDISAYHDKDYYFNKIFNSGYYDRLIVMAAIEVLGQHGKTDVLFDYGLRLAAEKVIKSQSTPETIKNNWFKLQSLCDEFKKLSDEVLSLTVFEDRILTSHVNGYGIFRPSSYFECFQNKTLSSPDGQLMRIFDKFRTVISNRSYHKLYEELLKLKNVTADDVTRLFSSFVEGRISPEEIRTILGELEKIPDSVELVKSLIGNNGFELISNDQDYTILGDFNRISSITIFKNIITAHENLLMDLVVLLIICETNEALIGFLNEIRKALWNYNVLDTVFDTSLDENEIVETTSMGRLQSSTFWVAVAMGNHKQLYSLINDCKLNEAFDYLCNNILSSDNYLIDVVVELIKNRQSYYLKPKFLDKLNQDKVIDRFLLGVIYAFANDGDSFCEVFNDYDFFKDMQKTEQLEPLEETPILCDHLSTFFNKPTKSQYFNAVAGLADVLMILNNKGIEIQAKSIEIACKFKLLAIENEPSKQIQQNYYGNLLDLSLEVSNYDLITKCFNNLTTVHYFKGFFTRFINQVAWEDKLDIIFPSTSQNSDYDIYKKYFSLVDDIILECANNASLSRSLKYYEYLYSWRLIGCTNGEENKLGDKRGAIEALYLFITRFISESDKSTERKVKLKILEFYMIILNVFKSFTDDEDKWILKYTGNQRSIIKLDDLKIEYLEWLKILDDDLTQLV